jgi:flagellar motility protein MotE (MotC chaperone)
VAVDPAAKYRAAAARLSRPIKPAPQKRPPRRGSRVPQLRLLPVTIVVAMAMLMVRVNDIWTNVNDLAMPHLALNRSEAQQPPPPGGKKKKNEPSPMQPVGVAPAGTQPAPAASAGLSGGSMAEPQNGAAAGGADASPAAVPGGQAAEGEPPIFTQNEVDVLEKLSARRQELDKREHDVELRENLLKAAEDRIDKKIAEMKALQSNVQAMLEKIDEQDDAKIKSLVKIYETMKPKDAARIFEQLEMPVLLKVVQNMKEQKVAPVMEQMDAGKAKALTDAIAAQRTAKIEGNTPATTEPAPPAAGAPAAPPPAPGG